MDNKLTKCMNEESTKILLHSEVEYQEVCIWFVQTYHQKYFPCSNYKSVNPVTHCSRLPISYLRI